MKSGGVSGVVTVSAPSWCECINVSSKSSTMIFLRTESVQLKKKYTRKLVLHSDIMMRI